VTRIINKAETRVEKLLALAESTTFFQERK
jgi:hypothetical protein